MLSFLTANLYEARFSYFSTKTTHHNRFNIEAYMRVQLVSVKVYTKDVCRGIEIVPPSQICLEEIVIFLKSMLFILTCNGLIIIIFKGINKCFLNFSVLVSSVVCIHSCNPHKQNLWDS